MDKETTAIGIDVGKHKLDVALIIEGKVRSKSVANSSAGYQELTAWLARENVELDNCLVCMESTGVYSEPVALGLQTLGLTVSIVNPARIKGYGQSEVIRNKNDGIDAALIARYCAKMQPKPWKSPTPEQRRLRAWCDRLKALKDMRLQEENRQEACTIASNMELVEHIKRHVEWLKAEIKQVEHQIEDHIACHPKLKRDSDLMASIPGIGKATVAVMLGHVGDMQRFDSAKALAAHLGVSPRQRSSGTSIRGRTSMCRTGEQGDTKRALYAGCRCQSPQPRAQGLCRAPSCKWATEESGDWSGHAQAGAFDVCGGSIHLVIHKSGHLMLAAGISVYIQ